MPISGGRSRAGRLTCPYRRVRCEGQKGRLLATRTRGIAGPEAAGSGYLRIVGPTFGLFGFGMALCFASQGAGCLAWPLAVTLLRTTIAVGGAVAIGWAGPSERSSPPLPPASSSTGCRWRW